MGTNLVEEITNKMQGIGPRIGVPYTNQQMIDASKSLQEAIAHFISVIMKVDYLKGRDVRKYIADAADKYGLSDQEIFQKLDSDLEELGYTIATFIKGIKGEQIIKDALKLLEYDKGVKVLYNISLESDGVQAEYDAIVISPYGMSVVEVKNWSGEVYLDKWGLLSKANSGGAQYDVPGRMNAKEYLLRKCLGEEFPEVYQGILLFSQNNSRIQDDFHQIPICYGGSIVNYIRSGYEGKQILSERQINEIVGKISSLHKEQFTISKIDGEEIIRDFAIAMATIEDGVMCDAEENSVQNNNSGKESEMAEHPGDNCSEKKKVSKINWNSIMSEAATIAACLSIGMLFSGIGIKPWKF